MATHSELAPNCGVDRDWPNPAVQGLKQPSLSAAVTVQEARRSAGPALTSAASDQRRRSTNRPACCSPEQGHGSQGAARLLANSSALFVAKGFCARDDAAATVQESDLKGDRWIVRCAWTASFSAGPSGHHLLQPTQHCQAQHAQDNPLVTLRHDGMHFVRVMCTELVPEAASGTSKQLRQLLADKEHAALHLSAVAGGQPRA